MPAAEKIPVMRPEKKQKRGSAKLKMFVFLFFASLLAVLFFQSSISKIASIEVEGNAMVSDESVVQASGLLIGDHFFGTGSSTIAKRIETLEAVQQAKVRKRFPGLIKIEIIEFPRVAFLISSDGKREAVLANGHTVALQDGGLVVDKPILTNWSADDPWYAKLCQALSDVPAEQLSAISEIRPAPSVSYPDKIKMYTRSQFEVYTTVTKLKEKLEILDELISEMEEKNTTSGVFELLEVDVHKPFELYYESEGNEDPANGANERAADENGGNDASKN